MISNPQETSAHKTTSNLALSEKGETERDITRAWLDFLGTLAIRVLPVPFRIDKEKKKNTSCFRVAHRLKKRRDETSEPKVNFSIYKKDVIER